MAKVKKMPSVFNNYREKLEDYLDKLEVKGAGAFRIRERKAIGRDPQLSNIGTIRGFEVFGKSVYGVWGYDAGVTYMYPSIDGYRYGYVPATEYNLKKLKYLLADSNLVLDDPEYIDKAIKEAEAEGLSTEYKQIVSEYGITVDGDLVAKQRKLEKLKSLIDEKSVDDEIKELEAKLGISEPVVAVVESKPQSDESADLKGDEQVAPAKKTAPLAGKSIKKD